MSDKCPEYVDRLYAYIDGELTAEQYEEIKAHLLDCPPCLTEYERDMLLKKLIKRACACEQAPEQLRSSILTRITYERTSVRFISSLRSDFVVTASSSMGRVKLGQPVPLSNLSVDENSG